MQLKLDGKTAEVCVFCGNPIGDTATEKFLRKDRGRCPLCEIEYLTVVFSLADEDVERLKKKWVCTI